MLKKLCLLTIFLLIFCFNATLLGKKSASTYFPDTLGSFWVYEDQDGNELTREAVQKKEIPSVVYHAFSYEPAFEDWGDYAHHFYPSRYQVSDDSITFFDSDGIEKAIKARLTKEIETLMRVEPPGNVDVSYEVKADVEEQFLALPMPISLNEEWDAGKFSAVILIKTKDPDQTREGDLFAFNFTVFETGSVLNKETVETPAGSFENCLKIEYRTETTLHGPPGGMDSEPPGESVTTLWLAPNIGIVKFRQEMEDMFLKTVPVDEIPFSKSKKTLELKEYEIKSDNSENEINYFPTASGSRWVYVDKDGNELTRRAMQDEVIPPKTYNAFNYKPAIEKWEDYEAYTHPSLYQVGKTGIELYIGDAVEKAVQARLKKEMDIFIEAMKGQGPPYNADIKVQGQDHLLLLPDTITHNEEWNVNQIEANVTFFPHGVDVPRDSGLTIDFTILETGIVLGTETVEISAGTFEECLKVEYRTETKVSLTPQPRPDEIEPAGETVTTVWFAPNVGIVKFHQKSDHTFLEMIPDDVDFSINFSPKKVKTLELKKYEIKTTDSENSESK